MKIKDEQAKLAVDMLRGGGMHFTDHIESVDPQVIARAVCTAVETPDTRPDVIREVRERFALSAPSADEVARKMLLRIASDALR